MPARCLFRCGRFCRGRTARILQRGCRRPRLFECALTQHKIRLHFVLPEVHAVATLFISVSWSLCVDQLAALDSLGFQITDDLIDRLAESSVRQNALNFLATQVLRVVYEDPEIRSDATVEMDIFFMAFLTNMARSIRRFQVRGRRYGSSVKRSHTAFPAWSIARARCGHISLEPPILH